MRGTGVLGQAFVYARWGLGPAGQVRAAAIRSPERVALIDEDGQLSYAALYERCTRLAVTLRDWLALREGDRVGIMCANHRSAVEAMVATLMIGCDAVLISTHLKQRQTTEITDRHGVRALLRDENLRDFASAVPCLGLPLPEDAGTTAGLRPPRRTGRLIVMTSGTTGQPKGALRPKAGLGGLLSIYRRLPLRSGDRMYLAVPIFGAWGNSVLQAAFVLRSTVVLRRRFEPSSALALIDAHECDTLIAAPVMLHLMLECAERPTCLRKVITSGAALGSGLAPRFMDRYGDILYNVYGSTEASCASIAAPAHLRRAPDTAGQPPRGTKISILDTVGRPVPDGQIGRVFVRNRMLFDGYTSGPGTGPVRGMLATGDLGHWDPGRLLHIDGRADEMIVSGGENVFPGPVESVIRELEQVIDVAVVGVSDPIYGQCFAAFAVLRTGNLLEPDEIRAHVRALLPRAFVPRDVTFVAAIPRNPAGKVITRELIARWPGAARKGPS